MQSTQTNQQQEAPSLPLLWRNRDYMLLWSRQLVSNIGSQVSQLAFPLLILALTHSPAQAGIARLQPGGELGELVDHGLATEIGADDHLESEACKRIRDGSGVVDRLLQLPVGAKCDCRLKSLCWKWPTKVRSSINARPAYT